MFFAQDPTNNFYYLGVEEPNSRTLNSLLDNPPRLIACDVESISLKERVPIGIGIAISPFTAFYFQLFPVESSVTPWRLLRDPAITTIWHNGIYDLDCLAGYNVNQDIQDTSVMARLQAYKFNSLIGLSWLHKMEVHEASDMLKGAGTKTMLDLPTSTVARKCMQDAMATFKLYMELLPKTDLPYYNVERATIPIMLRMSYRGIALDQPMRAMIEQGLESEVTRLKNICDETEMFNPGSPQQVSYVLAKRKAYSIFPRLPFTKNKFGRKTSTLSTNVDVLKAMDDPLAQIILEYRMNTKLLSTYIRPWAGKDRARTRYHLDAITGRPSSTSGGDTDEFRNMQNIPGKFRKDGTEYPYNCRGCLLPDTGMWTDVDLEQVEPRVLAYLSGDRDMNYIFSQPKYRPDGSRNEEGDIHLQVANFMGVDRKLGKITNLCVPMTTQALTPDGWKPQQELQKGDFVLGYSSELESYIWTRIVSVMEPTKCELMQFGNEHTKLVSTDSHRWYGRQRHHYHNKQLDYYSNEVRMLKDIGKEFEITLASRMDNTLQIYDVSQHIGRSGSITPREAAIIAWLYTDGYVRKDRSTAQIFQSKPNQVSKIRDLLSIVPHTEDNPREDGVIVWRLSFPWVKNLLREASLWSSDNMVRFVLHLSDSSRVSFLAACIDAEGGYQQSMGVDGKVSRQLSMWQNSGPILDAMQLAASLEGYFTKQLDHPNKDYPNSINKAIRLRKPYMTCQRLAIFNRWVDYVWCMQTGVGSWVAKDSDGQIFITGNAMTYGATDETLMDETGIKSKGRVQQLKQMWAEKFPQAWDWIQSRQEDALRTGVAVTAFGRKMRLPTLDEESADGIKRKAIDYPCQGTAADILKRSLIALQDMDLALQEHDELLVDGFEPKEKFEVMEHIAPFHTPVEIKYLNRWE